MFINFTFILLFNYCDVSYFQDGVPVTHDDDNKSFVSLDPVLEKILEMVILLISYIFL